MEMLYGAGVVRKGRSNQMVTLHRACTENPRTFVTTAEEVARLFEVVQIPRGWRCADVFAGTNGIAKHSEGGASWVTNDISTSHETGFHFDALNPAQWPFELIGRIDAFVCSPPFEMLDLVLPDLLARAKKMLILHVPGDFLSNAPEYRRAFIGRLEKRVLVVAGLPKSNTRRCIWVVIVKNKRLWTSVLKTSASPIPLYLV